MDIKELREAANMSLTEFSKYFAIPYRSLQNWERQERQAPEYLISLIEYKLRNEKLIK